MSDVYTSVSHRSLGDNLIESIKGFLVGIVLFFAAFPILWVNEGCVDLSTVAKTAVVVKPDGNGGGEGKLISVTSELKIDETVGDPELLNPGQWATLRRKVEMYAWKEKKETSTTKKVGGGSTTTTTYTYDLTWAENPQRSDGFAHAEGHQNPEPGIAAKSFFPAHAKVGVFAFAPADIELPAPGPLSLTASMVKQEAPRAAPAAPAPQAPAPTPAGKLPPGKRPAGKNVPPAKAPPPAAPAPSAEAPTGNGFRLAGDYLFRGKGSLDHPALGDVRVSYEVIVSGKKVTLYGQRQGTNVVAYMHEGKDALFRVLYGTHEEAMARLHNEHVMMTWIARIGGFFAMWIGMSLVLGPFNAVLDIIPFVGRAGRFVTGLVLFPVAGVLSTITIVVSIVAHSTILLVLTIVLIAGGITALILVKKKNAPPAPPQPAMAGMPPGGGPPMGGFGGPPPGGGYGGPPPGGGYGGPPPGGGYGGPPPGGGWGGPPQGGGNGGPPPGGGYGPPPGGGGWGPPPGGR